MKKNSKEYRSQQEINNNTEVAYDIASSSYSEIKEDFINHGGNIPLLAAAHAVLSTFKKEYKYTPPDSLIPRPLIVMGTNESSVVDAVSKNTIIKETLAPNALKIIKNESALKNHFRIVNPMFKSNTCFLFLKRKKIVFENP